MKDSCVAARTVPLFVDLVGTGEQRLRNLQTRWANRVGLVQRQLFPVLPEQRTSRATATTSEKGQQQSLVRHRAPYPAQCQTRDPMPRHNQTCFCVSSGGPVASLVKYQSSALLVTLSR